MHMVNKKLEFPFETEIGYQVEWGAWPENTRISTVLIGLAVAKRLAQLRFIVIYINKFYKP